MHWNSDLQVCVCVIPLTRLASPVGDCYIKKNILSKQTDALWKILFSDCDLWTALECLKHTLPVSCQISTISVPDIALQVHLNEYLYLQSLALLKGGLSRLPAFSQWGIIIPVAVLQNQVRAILPIRQDSWRSARHASVNTTMTFAKNEMQWGNSSWLNKVLTCNIINSVLTWPSSVLNRPWAGYQTILCIYPLLLSYVIISCYFRRQGVP